MPKQIDQLPPDATSMARRLAALEREVRELRASRRLGSATAGLIRTAASGPRIELDGTTQALAVFGGADGTTLLAELAPETDGGGGMWTRGFQSPFNLSAFLGGGEIRFRTVDTDAIAADAEVLYDTDGATYTDLLLSSGGILDTDQRAHILLESLAGGAAPSVYITGDGANTADLDVDGRLTTGNIAYGQVSITPGGANSATSTSVGGLNVKGSIFYGYAVAQTTQPGFTGATNGVTGASATNVTSTGLTVWATRQNTTVTLVNWLVIGI